MSEPARRRWARAYARLRRTEGRGAGGTRELFALPWVTDGPLAAQWRIRARTFDAFLRRVVAPLERERGRALHVLDLGAGNGWLSARLAERGHRCVAADLRVDDVDGLAAAPGGRVAVLDSPFYARAASGDAMRAEKRRETAARFADVAEDLLALSPVEFLTRERLAAAAAPAGLAFRRRRVLYSAAYEARGVVARLKGARAPSRFDLWVADAPGGAA